MRHPIVLYCVLSGLCLTGCNYGRFGDLKGQDTPALTANTTLASVERFYRDGGTDLPEGTIVGGTVTTSDSSGNFYKMLVIQQDGTPLAVLTGTYDTYTAYRPGEHVVLLLDGLRLGLRDGMLSVGAPEPNFPKGIDYIASDAVLRRIMTRSTLPAKPVDTLELTVPEVKASHAGRLVRVNGGHFTQGGKHTWSGEQTFADDYGNTLKVYTSPYASFADNPLPEGVVELTGIVTVYDDVVQIKVSSTDDVCPIQP